MKRLLPFLLVATTLPAQVVFAEEQPKFDGSPFSSFSYEGKRLIEPRIESVDTNGVKVTDKEGENSVVVPLDRALKHPELRMRAKDAIKACQQTSATGITVNTKDVTVNAENVTVQQSANTNGPTCNKSSVLNQPLTKTERAQMIQNVVWAKLARNQSQARKLNDTELRALNEKALPIIAIQQLKSAL